MSERSETYIELRNHFKRQTGKELVGYVVLGIDEDGVPYDGGYIARADVDALLTMKRIIESQAKFIDDALTRRMTK